MPKEMKISKKAWCWIGIFIGAFLACALMIIIHFYEVQIDEIVMSLVASALILMGVSMGILEILEPESMLKGESYLTLNIGGIFFLTMGIIAIVVGIIAKLPLYYWIFSLGVFILMASISFAFFFNARKLKNRND